MKFFDLPDRSPQEVTQRRLMMLAALFLLVTSVALTFAPAVRFHTLNTELRWQHWIGLVVWVVGFSFAYKQADRFLPDRDPYLLPIISLFCGWGLLTLFRLDPAYGFKQTIWLAICLAGLAVGVRFKTLLPLLRRYKYIWLSLALILTVLTFFFGTNPSGSGPNLWLGMGGIYLQPSEILKLVLVIYLAAYLAEKVTAGFRFIQLLTPTLLVAGFALIVLVIQRDLGTASLFIALYTVVIYIASGKRRFLLISFLVIVAALITSYYVFDVVRIRVEGWLNPWLDPNDHSYQIVQSIIAIANGGIFGRGIGLGSPGVVPVAQSDFIYPSIIEETGFMGAIAIILLFAVLTLRGFYISLHAPNQFQRYLAAGLTTYLVSQALLIMGGTIRLLPLTGVTLPFFSYGGSSLVTAFFAVLLLLMISNQNIEQSTPLFQTRAYFFAGTVFLSALTIVALVTSWWSIFRADDLLARNDNPRRFISDQYVKRGSILDRNNTILAETIGEPGDLQRVLSYAPLSAVVGYSNSNYGQGGLEAGLDSTLRGVYGNSDFAVFSTRLLTAQYPQGADVRLSLDLKLQQKADSLLSGHTGAIVLLNAKTGEILASSTSPTFDANTLEENWSTWIVDTDSPLLNRVTQGLYPTGTSTGGLLLANLLSSRSLPPTVSNVEWSADVSSQKYCASDPGSNPTWGQMIASGCNQSLTMLEYYVGKNSVDALYQQLEFDSFNNEIEDSGTFSMDATPEPAEAATDSQDILLVSPLQMAIAYAPFSNGGVSITPVLATGYRYEGDDWILFPDEETPAQLPSMNTASATAALSSSAIPGWSISSTASTTSTTVNWYIAGTQTEWQGTPIILVVALENSNAQTAETFGRDLFNTTINSVK